MRAVLPPTVYKRVLFFWCPHLQERNEAQVNSEPPSCVNSRYILYVPCTLENVMYSNYGQLRAYIYVS
jgi:hypothetical protein